LNFLSLKIPIRKDKEAAEIQEHHLNEIQQFDEDERCVSYPDTGFGLKKHQFLNN
jgi:hypothetical protein